MRPYNLQLALARLRATGAPLRSFLAAPGPARKLDYRQAELLAVDLELSALLPAEGEILSIGYVPIRNGAVFPGEGKHLLLCSSSGVGQSAAIHGIHDRDLEDAMSPAAALSQWLAEQAGRPLVAHQARLDLRFLQRYCVTLFGAAVPLRVIDTMQMEKRRLERTTTPVGRGGLRLDACRRRYNLPHYKSHHALADAVATAELFLAQASNMAGDKPLPLGALFTSL
jgi:DNA polymerase-3 subunit epsilon